MCRGTFEQNINKRHAELFRESKQITRKGKIHLDDMVDVFAFSNVVFFLLIDIYKLVIQIQMLKRNFGASINPMKKRDRIDILKVKQSGHIN